MGRSHHVRILLINPNTSPEITDLVAQYARASAGGAEIFPVTGRFGARYIASRAAAAIAAHAALDLLAEHVARCDAVYLACFGDPGLFALREVSPVPVVGMAEASCRLAAVNGRTFSIVTGGVGWGPMLREFVAMLDLSDKLASVRTIAPTGGTIVSDRNKHLEALAQACRASADEDGADVVILGGAALAGLANVVAPGLPIPVICSVQAGMLGVLNAIDSPIRSSAGQVKNTAVESIGLSTNLTALLAGRGARSVVGP